MPPLFDYLVDPDGVLMEVRWDRLSRGTSVFIPCLDIKEAKRQVYAYMKTQGWTCRILPWVDKGKMGIRVWRTV